MRENPARYPGQPSTAARIECADRDRIAAGVPDDEQAKIAGVNTASVYNFDVARLTVSA
jgi:hypothetical protein